MSMDQSENGSMHDVGALSEDPMLRVVASGPDLWRFLEHPEEFYSSCEKSPLLYGLCDSDRNTALLLAIKGNHDAAVDALLDAGGPHEIDHQNVKGVTALALAAQKGRLNHLARLIECGGQVDIPNYNGSTALIQASHFGHLDVVDLLLQHHARVDTRNKKGTTALMRAAQEGHLQVVQRLLKNKSDVNARNEDGMNALMLGSQRGHHEIVSVLIEHSAAIDGRTVQGSTALMLSCKRGHHKVVQTLLEAGAELCVKDSKGRVARDQASRRGQEKILDLLQPARQMELMQHAVRIKRTLLLGRLYRLINDGGRATLNASVVRGSPSLQCLARVMGCVVPPTPSSLSSSSSAYSSPLPLPPPLSPPLSASLTSTATATTPHSASHHGHSSPGSVLPSCSPVLQKGHAGIAPPHSSSPAFSSSPSSSSSSSSSVMNPLLPAAAQVEGGFATDSLAGRQVQTLASASPSPSSTIVATTASSSYSVLDSHPLPQGLVELVVSFMPLPNLYSSEISRLERRLRIDACDAAVRGAFEMMDQIVVDLRPDRVLRSATMAAAAAAAPNAATTTDATSTATTSYPTSAAATTALTGASPPFPTSPSLHPSMSSSTPTAAAATLTSAATAVPHDGWLVRLASNFPLQEALVAREGLPPPTLRALLAEHHLQGALKRHGSGITVDAAVAAQVVALCSELHAWAAWRMAPSMFPDPQTWRARKLGQSALMVQMHGDSSGGGGGGSHGSSSSSSSSGGAGGGLFHHYNSDHPDGMTVDHGGSDGGVGAAGGAQGGGGGAHVGAMGAGAATAAAAQADDDDDVAMVPGQTDTGGGFDDSESEDSDM